jgi:hypothetical protein
VIVSLDQYQISRAIRNGFSTNIPTGAGSIVVSAGTLSSLRSDVTFANSNGISFGLNGLGVITATVAPAGGGLTNINISGGTTSSNVSAVTFSNGSGVTFGYDGTNVTASVQTNYQTPGAYLTTAQPPGAYLTTAMASNGGSDFVQANATFFGTNATGTIASNAISVSVAAPSGGGAGTGFTTTSTAGSDLVGTLSTNGLSLGVPAWLTTAATASGLTAIKISAGTLSSNRSDVTFADSNGVTFGLETNGVITASINQVTGAISVVKFSAGTLSSNRTDLTFSNSNGVSFGLDTNGVITATVETNYQSPGAYLTTAALSGDTSNYAGTGFTSTTTAGTNIVATLNTSGLSMGIPAYLTTSPSGTLSNIKISAGTVSTNRSDVTFSNGGGVSFGLDTNGVITASIATTYAGTGFTTATTAGTNIVGTLNTSGLSMGIPAYLTTATGGAFTPRLDQVLDANTDKLFNQNFNALEFQWAGGGSFSTNSTRNGMFEIDVQGNVTDEADVMHVHHHGGAPTKLDMIHVEADGANVTGLRLQMSASIAAAVNQPIKFTTEDSGYAIGTVPFILGTSMSNSVANLNVNYLQGALSSQFAGTGFTSTSTAGSNIVATLNTSGLSMGIPVYATGAALTNINISAGTTSTNASAFTFSNSNQVTFGLGTGASAGVVTASFDLVNTVSNALATLSWFQNIPMSSVGPCNVGNRSALAIAPIILPQAISADYVRFFGNLATNSSSAGGTSVNTSFTLNRSWTYAMMIMTQGTGGNSQKLVMSTSTMATFLWRTSVTAGATGSNYTVGYDVSYPVTGSTTNFGTSTGIASAAYVNNPGPLLSNFVGAYFLDVPFPASLSAGNYWVALGSSSDESHQGPGGLQNGGFNPYAIYGAAQVSSYWYDLGATSNTIGRLQPGNGSWTTNSAFITTTPVAFSQISGFVSNCILNIQIVRRA